MEFEEKTIDDQFIAVISNKGTLEAAEVLFAKLAGWLEEEEVETAGDPFMIFYKLPENTEPDKVVYDVGVPIKELVKGNDLINTANMISHKVLTTIHKGGREHIKETYTALAQYAVDNNYDIIGSPKEVYIKGFLEKTDDKLIEIQLPVIKM